MGLESTELDAAELVADELDELELTSLDAADEAGTADASVAVFVGPLHAERARTARAPAANRIFMSIPFLISVGDSLVPQPVKYRPIATGARVNSRPRNPARIWAGWARIGRVTGLLNHPQIVLAVALATLGGAAFLGDQLRNRVRPVAGEERADLDLVLTATLTLLGLLLGFSFSMAVSRYDQRKNAEAAEANTIAAEYRRADLLTDPARSKIRELMGRYVDERIAYYRSEKYGVVADDTLLKLQADLWSTVSTAANTNPNPVVALAVSGMDDVFTSRGTTQAAWLNRIPTAAWALLASTALLVNLLLGYRERRTDVLVLTILPLAVSTALFLIADIDSPRTGLVRVAPANLEALAVTIHAPQR